MSSILEKSMKKCLQISNINDLKKLLKNATVQRTNSFFMMVIYHKTAERRKMPCTKWVSKNSVYQHGVLTMNPIENVFNYLRTNLHEEFLNRNITFENSWRIFCSCQKKLLSGWRIEINLQLLTNVLLIYMGISMI